MYITFEQWMLHCEAILKTMIGLSLQDLPDIDYHALWSYGYTPTEAVKESLRAKNLY